MEHSNREVKVAALQMKCEEMYNKEPKEKEPDLKPLQELKGFIIQAIVSL